MSQFVSMPEKVLVSFGTALTADTAKITIVGKHLSDQELRDWLATIPEPIEPCA